MGGMCGKKPETANLMDLLLHTLKGIAVVLDSAGEKPSLELGRFVSQALFATITNANFDNERITGLIENALKIREELKVKYLDSLPE
jgi:hydroxylamine reductase